VAAVLRGTEGAPLLAAGTVIPAVLLHRLHSSEPGLVRGQVTRDVRDSAGGEVVLVPRGALVYGRQARVPRLGDRRVVVAWERLRYPDGRVLELGGEPTAAADGALGVPGRVRQRWGQRLGAAALLSLVGAGAQLSQPQRSATLGAAPSPGQIAAGELGLETSRLAHRILDRTVDLPPEIELEPGARLSILLTRDLAFEGPSFPSGPASAGPPLSIDSRRQ
jgi:type IV secretion system protein VirB10